VVYVNVKSIFFARFCIAMETNEFYPIFRKVPYLENHFLGVFPIDKIPSTIKPKCFFVCNTDPSYLAGKHWIAFINIDKNECEIFDSLGVKINELKPYFKFSKKVKFIFNTTQFQSTHSKLCGLFVVTFIIERMLNQSMEFDEILENIFSSDTLINDKIVTDFCSNL